MSGQIKQYCRYCVHLATGNGVWCSERGKVLSESYTKGVNTCKDFDFCEMDAYAENPKPYKPRGEYRKGEAAETAVNQIKFDDFDDMGD